MAINQCAMRYISDLDSPLLKLSTGDYFSLRDACQGVAVTGSIGSGKTSGSGAALAGAYLRAGMGGLILCAKPEEASLWRKYLADHGRADSLIEFAPGSHGFNFLSYEISRQGGDGINAVVECLMRVLEAARSASPTAGKSGDAFWEDTTRQMLRNAVPVLFAAYGRVTIPDIIEFVRSAPRSPDEMQDRHWQASSFFCATFMQAEGRIADDMGKKAVSYWRYEYASFDPKLRSNVTISLTTTLDRFNHGWLQHALCGDTTLVPELCFHGAVILLNMPALTYNEDGIIAQQVIKYMWQRAVLARNGLDQVHRDRPVFLWADEAQYFVNSYDAEFLSTCRGSKACTVFLSQSLPTYAAKLSGENVQARVQQLLGNFATKVYHSQACPETNEWAARSIGRSLQRRASYNEGSGGGTNWGMNDGLSTNSGNSWGGGSTSSTSPQGTTYGSSSHYGGSSGSGESRGGSRGYSTSYNSSQGYSEQMDYVIEPGEFARMLKTGGPANRNVVSAVWFQAGRQFAASGLNFLFTSFKQ